MATVAGTTTPAALRELRTQVLESTGVEEKVEVNQRHLIDKILARYSAPFTVFRELVQNANDAGASTVEITFICGEPSETTSHVLHEGIQPPQKVVDDEDSGKGVMSTAIRVRNDGRPFSKDDWNRLKKIAEGNPDENKIGMFGVGFYSLFSVCEEPFVSSAGECIAFYWKGDQLFAKRAAAPVEIDDARENPWTTFFMVLRGNGVEVPDIDGDGGFGAFLATNLGFTSSLRSVTVDLQIGNSNTRLFGVTKAVSEPRPMTLLPGLRTVSPCKMLRLSVLDVCQVQMEAAYLIMPKAKPKSGTPAKNTGLISIGSFGGRVGNGLSVFLRGITGIGGGSSKVQKNLETVAGAILDERSYAASATGGYEKPKPHTVTERIFVRVARGHLVATLDKAWCAEFVRTAKKQPPARPILQIIYTGHDEMEASSAPQRDSPVDSSGGAGSSNQKVKSDESIFRDLIPYPQQGRIFIGFPTFQTTGNNLHLSSHLIPTVERESIDLIDRCLAIWNQELLSVGGLLSRALYEDEMIQINRLFKEMVRHAAPGAVMSQADEESSASAREWLESRATHALMAFHYRPSTPSPAVAEFIHAAFTASTIAQQSLLSSHGVLTADQIRLPFPEELASLIKTVPTIRPSMAASCRDVLDALERAGVLSLRRLDATDLLLELGRRTLKIPEAVAMLRMCFNSYSVLSRSVDSILDVALVIDAAKDPGAICQIGAMQWFLNPKVIPTDMPLPSNVLPYPLTKEFTLEELEMGSMRRWSVLPFQEWVSFIANHPDFIVSPLFAEKVLGVVSRAWLSLGEPERLAILGYFTNKNCVPTKAGMRKPQEAYFPMVTLFEDLPVITLGRGVSEKLLSDLGVRKHVDLQMVFDRLESLEWNHVQLCKYLASVNLSAVELSRLKVTPLFPAEVVVDAASAGALGDEPNKSNTESSGTPAIPRPPAASSKRYTAGELYCPMDIFRSLNFPVLAWTGKWKPHSPEVEFLLKLGLHEFVPLSVLLPIAANKEDGERRTRALNYFLANYEKRYAGIYRPEDQKDPFVPTNVPGKLALPGQVFSDYSCSILGFLVLSLDLVEHADKLGVRKHPHSEELVNRLLKLPPKNADEAKRVFEYLYGRMGDFGLSQWTTLARGKFIPVKGQPPNLVDPASVYLGGADDSTHQEHFDYVDFGPVANAFLKAAGVKPEPSPTEVAWLVVRAAEQLLASIGTEKYLGILRQLATHQSELARNRTLWADLRKSPVLLATQMPDQNSGRKPEGEESEESVHQYILAPANKIFVIDDIVLQQLFNVPSAPMETLLEAFYEHLGSSWIRREVKQQYVTRGQPMQTPQAQKLEQLIKERSPLLLHEHQRAPNSDVIHNAHWVKSNLQVLEVDGIAIEHTLLNTKKVQQTTACITQNKFRRHLLLVSGEVDYFDVASALGQVLFRKCRLNDRLLLATLLSTSLTNLKRKGFPVDRILNIPKKEIPPLIKHPSSPQQQQQLQTMEKDASLTPSTPKSIAPTAPKQQPLSAASSTKTLPVAPPATASDEARRRADHEAPGTSLSSMRDNNSTGSLTEPSVETARRSNSFLDKMPGEFGSFMRDALGIGQSHRQQALGSGGGAAPRKVVSEGDADLTIPRDMTAHLKKNLRAAVRSCRKSDSTDITNTGGVSQIEEASRTYCDARPSHQLSLLGQVQGMDVYLDKRFAENDVLHSPARKAALVQFVGVLKRLAGVFELPPEAVHVYFDGDGTTIAFNRGRTLFFNFRYYLAYHDEVGKPPREEAYYYWFVRFCHELAHNFSANHDANFAFYLASFAEFYMKKLSATLNTM